MLWHVAEPLDAGGLEANLGVKAADDGLVDGGLLLLLQQRDELPLGGDVAPDAPVHVVQIPHDGGLLGEGWEGNLNGLDARVSKAVSCNAIRPHVKLIGNRLTLQSPSQACPQYCLEGAQ